MSERLGFKYVTWQCGYEYNPGGIKSFLTHRFLKRFHYHLAYHTGAKKYLFAHGVDGSRMIVIHNTLDEQQIRCIPRNNARKTVATELQLPVTRPIVLYVGAVLAEKRLDALIDAVRLLGRDAVSLVIVGDGPALTELKSSAADLDCIRFPGRIIKRVGCFFDAADVFVLPGTGGLAINEAMIHGLPIISGGADGSAEDLVADGLNGYLLKQDHAEEIATYLEKLLSDPEARLRMGRVSRELITAKYSFKKFIDRVMEGLHAALGESEEVDDGRRKTEDGSPVLGLRSL
jgi:glycosyltransferase involved in cell wall biosynthesis